MRWLKVELLKENSDLYIDKVDSDLYIDKVDVKLENLSRTGGITKWMGICLSSKVKAYNSSNAGLGSRDGKSLPSSSSVPQNPATESEILPSPSLMRYSFNDLKLATRNFRPESVLGVGGFGPVYKGWIDEKSGAPSKPDSGLVVAVKKLDKQGPQGHREWLAEINYLGQLRHPNLVKLVGYCLEDDGKMLVYEFMPRGSMENHLFRRGSHFQPLSWSIRMKVATDAARGLAFLHSDEVKVIYRDFKTSNILLDLNYNAKLSDFGLARDGPKGDRTHVSTRVMGTYGYAAPEYLATGHLTPKTDVYSFGVVLVEMLTGRRAVDRNQPPGQQNAVEWAKPYLVSKRRLLNVMDARIEGQYSLEEAHAVATLALQCLSDEARSRPTMDQVLSALLQFQKADRQITAPTLKPSLANNHPVHYPRPSTALLFS